MNCMKSRAALSILPLSVQSCKSKGSLVIQSCTKKHKIKEKVMGAHLGRFLSQPLLHEPWRTLPSNSDHDDLLAFVKGYQPKNKDVECIRILLHGPVGAGKSSFINSVDSVLQDRITDSAPVDAISGKSYTNNYKTYRIAKDEDQYYPFVFNDTAGYEKNINSGVHVEDMKLVLRGHVNENYEFRPNKSLKEDDLDYRPNPTLCDRVHVLVCVIPANSVALLSQEVVKKMREVRETASSMGIPQIALLTKVDQCPEIGNKISNVHRSKNLKQQVDKLHLQLGISPNRIFLVKNFHQELAVNDTTNKLLLLALKQILQSGEDFLNNLLNR